MHGFSQSNEDKDFMCRAYPYKYMCPLKILELWNQLSSGSWVKYSVSTPHQADMWNGYYTPYNMKKHMLISFIKTVPSLKTLGGREWSGLFSESIQYLGVRSEGYV